MRTDFTSEQSVEVVLGDEASHEVTFEIGLECTARGYPGHFNPMTGDGEPPSGPEFDVTTITVAVPRVNPRAGESEFLTPLLLTWAHFSALVGEEIAEKLFDNACIEAAEKGGF